MGSNFLKDFYKKIKRRAHKKEHYHDPHELKVAKILKTKKKKRVRVCVGCFKVMFEATTRKT